MVNSKYCFENGFQLIFITMTPAINKPDIRHPNKTSVWCDALLTYILRYLSRIWPISLKEFTLVLDAKCGKRRSRKTLKGPHFYRVSIYIVSHANSSTLLRKRSKCINMCTVRCVYIRIVVHTYIPTPCWHTNALIWMIYVPLGKCNEFLILLLSYEDKHMKLIE